MKSIFSPSWPEVTGLVVLGGTLGAMLCGAGDLGLTWQTMLGALAGGTCAPLLFMVWWRSLAKVKAQARKPAQPPAQLQRIR
jgi:hypothetical protein